MAVGHLAKTTLGEGDDPDLTEDVAKKVVSYLKAHRLNAAEANKLGLILAASSRDQVRVYSFSQHSGGTRGSVTNVVLQWQNKEGQLFAYYLPVECGFDELYPLSAPGRTMYLLLGQEQGSSICMAGIAYVVELKGNYLILDNEIFNVKEHGNKNELTICNVAMQFDTRRQVLSVVADSTFGEPDVYSDRPFKPYKLLFRQGRFVKQL